MLYLVTVNARHTRAIGIFYSITRQIRTDLVPCEDLEAFKDHFRATNFDLEINHFVSIKEMK